MLLLEPPYIEVISPIGKDQSCAEKIIVYATELKSRRRSSKIVCTVILLISFYRKPHNNRRQEGQLEGQLVDRVSVAVG